jgi:UTP--glucose-1-phosphate uridylyltransferase
MNVKKAVITAAARSQRQLPLQVLSDTDGVARSVLEMLVREAVSAGIDQVGVVIAPGDRDAYASALGSVREQVVFVEQPNPRGYGDAIRVAADFVGDEPFLHLVGDHLFLSKTHESCAKTLVTVAQREECTVSAVQPTREHMLPYYGTIGGRLVAGQTGLYEVENVIEKPTPTEAEQSLIVPGMRAGHYLCFVGMHVLTAGVIQALKAIFAAGSTAQPPTLSDALARLTRQERYLALELKAARYNVGVKHGLLMAQLALALSGPDRDEILTGLIEQLAREHQHA